MRFLSNILMSIALLSCSSNQDESTSFNEDKETLLNKIEGRWFVESMIFQKIHACISLPLCECKTNYENRINTEAQITIDFNHDLTFLFADDKRHFLRSNYLVHDSALFFLNQKGQTWYEFRIDSTTTERIFLHGDYNLFYQLSKDSVKLFTSDHTKIILKRK